MAEIKWEIIKNLGVLSEGGGGWKKEMNIVSWNDRKPRVDIRTWDPEHKKMGKGVTLSKQEIENMKQILSEINPEDLGIE